MPYPLVERVNELERRVEKLERALAGAPQQMAEDAEEPTAAQADAAFAMPAEPTKSDPLSPTAPLHTEESEYGERLAQRRAVVAAFFSTEQTENPSDAADEEPPLMPTEIRTSIASTKESSTLLELKIGQWWTALAGAVVFVIGVALFIVLAVDRGWFHGVPPWVKCSCAGLVGVAMLVAAEFVRTRMGKVAAIGLNAAGLGVLYVTAYAAHAMYNLFSPGTTFVVLACVTTIGIAISSWARLASVGVVALVSGFVTPLIVRGDHTPPVLMPAYLGTLLAIGLGISAWKSRSKDPGNFWAVRFTGVIGTTILGLLWAVSSGTVLGAACLTLALAAFAATWAELFWSVSRAEFGGDIQSLRVSPADVSGVAGAATITVWAAWLATYAWHRLSPPSDWVGLTIMGAALLASAIMMHAEPRKLAARATSPFEGALSLAAGLGAALLFAASARALDGKSAMLVWAACGTAAAWSARRARVPALAAVGVVLLVIATARLLLLAFDPLNTTSYAETFRWGETAFSIWSWRLAGFGVLWLVSAREWAQHEADSGNQEGWFGTLGAVGCAVGAGLLAMAPFQIDWAQHAGLLSGHAVNLLLWSAMVVGLASLRPLFGRALIERAAAIPAGLALIEFGREYFTRSWASTAADAPAMLHPGLFASVMLSAAILWLAANIAAGTSAGGIGKVSLRTLPVAVWVFAAALPFVTSSLEVSRCASLWFTEYTARAAAVSLWWAIVAVALIGFGLRAGLRGTALGSTGTYVRRAGLGLFGLSLVKVVVYDLANVSLEWRVASFLGLGIGLMGVALGYNKLVKAVDRARQAQQSVETPSESASAE